MHFSYELEQSLTEDERKADEIFKKIKSELKNETYNITNLDYFDNFVYKYILYIYFTLS